MYTVIYLIDTLCYVKSIFQVWVIIFYNFSGFSFKRSLFIYFSKDTSNTRFLLAPNAAMDDLLQNTFKIESMELQNKANDFLKSKKHANNLADILALFEVLFYD